MIFKKTIQERMKGCGKYCYTNQDGSVNCGFYDECKEGTGIILCSQCKNIQKAQAQTLLDEKKKTLQFLEVIIKEISAFSSSLVRKIYIHKIQELQSEIKVLEGVVNG